MKKKTLLGLFVVVVVAAAVAAVVVGQKGGQSQAAAVHEAMDPELKLESKDQTIAQGILHVVHGDDFKHGKQDFHYALEESDGVYTPVTFQDEGPTDLDEGTSMVEIRAIRKGNSLQAKTKKDVRNLSTVAAGPVLSSISITSFNLINSDTDQPIGTLNNGDTIDLGKLPTRNINIQAVPSGSVAYVRFDYDTTANFRTDSASPYSLAGDTKGNYVAWTPSVGTHAVAATPYTGKGKNVSSGARASISFTVVDSTPLAAPTGMVATPYSQSEIDLQWNDVAGETSFILERRTASTTYSTIATLSQNIVRYSDLNLTSGTTYYYRVKAANSYGESSYSTEVSASTLAPVSLPDAPANLSAATGGTNLLSLQWADQSTNEQGFMIERRTATGSYAQIATVGQNITSYSDSGVSASTQYYYRVRAYNTAGTSLYSNESSATTNQISSAVPALSSRPGAPATLFLDFDGVPAMTWGSYSVPVTPAYDTDGNPSSFSSTELQNIRDMWARVAEKYSEFNVNVTTIDPGSYPLGKVLRVGIGGNGSWAGAGYGGISYVSSYTGGPNTSWVFPSNLANDPHYISEAIGHESGHGFGLQHQSSWSGTTKTAEYNAGDSLRAPTMGNSYYAQRGLWWNGLNTNDTMQDDMSIISGTRNAFGYRTDDFANMTSSAVPLNGAGASFTGAGVIEKTTDTDAFSLVPDSGTITISVQPVTGGMLDAKVQLVDSTGSVVTQADTSSLGETISAPVTSGTYYLIVGSHGNYGDVGQYTISASVTP